MTGWITPQTGGTLSAPRTQPSRQTFEELSTLRKQVLRICQQVGHPMTLTSITYSLSQGVSNASVSRTVAWLWFNNWLEMMQNPRVALGRPSEDVYYISEEVNHLV